MLFGLETPTTNPSARTRLRSLPEAYIAVFLLLVLVQMLLSGSMERMFYQALPVFSVLVAYSAEKLWSHTRVNLNIG